MKSIQKLGLVIIFIISFSLIAFSQAPPPPNGGNSPGGGNTPLGGGAPVGGGVEVLLILGVLYGGKKVFPVIRHQQK
jgi:hypothetical protein